MCTSAACQFRRRSPLPKLPVLSARAIVAALERAGFVPERSEGHLVLVHEESRRVAAVPRHGGRDVPTGTLRRIIRQAGLTPDEFVALLK